MSKAEQTGRGSTARGEARTATGPGVDVAIAAGLWVLGVVLCLHYGRKGFMPLDQSIVWDAGWRILCGQVPYRDFVTTTSLVPGLLQAGVFAVAGVSWLTYCAHAAVANGVFAAATFALLRTERLHPALAACFGAASAVFFYPPFGVPFGDQHSFLFGLLALLLASIARRTASIRGGLAWALVPALLLLGFLSKPVPVSFLLPAVGVVALWPGAHRLWPRVTVLLAGVTLSLGVLVTALLAGGADLGLAWEYLVELPLDSAERRRLGLGWFVDRLRGLFSLGGRSELVFSPAAVVATLLFVAGLTALLVRHRSSWGEAREALRPLAVALLLWLATTLFVGVTRNEARNGHALLPVALGLLAAALAWLGSAAATAAARSAGKATGLHRLAIAGLVGLALVALHDAVRFNATVNATRMVHHPRYRPRLAAAVRSDLPRALAFLEWSLPVRYTPADLRELVETVAAEPQPVLLVSDSLVVYALAGKPSVNANLWYDPGVSMPWPDDRPRMDRLDALFLSRLERAPPGLVVFDPPPGMKRFRLTMLPRVHTWLETRRCRTGRIARFPVWRLCSGTQFHEDRAP